MLKTAISNIMKICSTREKASGNDNYDNNNGNSIIKIDRVKQPKVQKLPKHKFNQSKNLKADYIKNQIKPKINRLWSNYKSQILKNWLSLERQIL